MNRIAIKQLIDINEAPEKEITVCGWVRSQRKSKNCGFLALNDGSAQEQLQIVVDDASLLEGDDFKNLVTGASLEATGLLVESPAKGQKWELKASTLKCLGKVAEDYPLQKKGHSLEFLREIAHLRSRSNTFGAMFRVRHVMAQAVHQFFSDKGFFWAQTPIITGSDGEGAGEMFEVKSEKNPDFFGSPAYLAVTGQLHGEFMALSMGNIYTFGPTFRAENSNTSRHLSEFWMIEPEMAFADLNDNIQLAQDFCQHLFQTAVDKCPSELEFFAKFYKNTSIEQLSKLAEASLKRVTYTEAIEILKSAKKSFDYPVSWGTDLQSEHERYLCEEVFNSPIALVDYPKEIKAFYMRINDDQKTVAAMDVLVPGVGELIGGSQREERMDILVARMKEVGIAPDSMDWYLDTRRYGGAIHSGFGMGFERLLMYITGMQNIRDTIIAPRAPKLCPY